MTIGRTGGLDPWFGAAPDYGAEIAAWPASIALLGQPHSRLRPVFSVSEGDWVAAGDTLYRDRRRPELHYVAPAAGIVAEIRRGPRRSFEQLLLTVDGDAARTFSLPDHLDAETLTALLVESGLWTSLRTRPFERVPQPGTRPDALFVTAIDTRPLAPDPARIIAPRADWFARGLAALSLLSAGKTWLCHKAGTDLPRAEGVEAMGFSGPHPAGLVGTHIHRLHPVGAGGTVWHISYQEVIAIGHLLATGRIWTSRVVGLAGDGVARPALLETHPGADLHDLCRDRLVDGPVRLLSGSPLEGQAGRYLEAGHMQVSVLRHRAISANHGWLAHARDWLSRGSGAILPNALHERAAPPGILAIPFLRAISVGDVETAQRLGALELAEEDLALLTYVDGGSTDFGRLLRGVLDTLEEAS